MKRHHSRQNIEPEPLLYIIGESNIIDSSQYSHSITNTNVVIQDNSMYFNGSAMLNTNIGDLKITNGVFTLEMWVKMENTLKTYKCIADFCDHSTMYFDASDSRDGTLVLINGAGSWQSIASKMLNGNVILTTNWQHVAIVGEGGHNYFYLNGNKITGGYF